MPKGLEAVGWQLGSEWRISVLAHAPTWDDWRTRCAFLGQEAHQEEWDAQAGSLGMPYREERYVVLAQRDKAG
ncbi:hypothetical protein [Deinococcus deserti]|uniref:hypothetical protein n=1 Tax=Deinococcus deserti TaxID=310783 RepID=UPI0002E4687F|nr:hypothetical protein [Deinococcus deserti]